jgi:hypothetical protein
MSGEGAMMIYLANTELVDLLDFYFVRMTLLVMGALFAWLMLGTRNAFTRIFRFAAHRSPFASRWFINPEKAGRIGLHGIDGADVLIGIVNVFARHDLTRSTGRFGRH